jgi:Cys-tRNA synthase (O-phospho-L-seryl-tRNA:Cys-tRNA synthase)
MSTHAITTESGKEFSSRINAVKSLINGTNPKDVLQDGQKIESIAKEIKTTKYYVVQILKNKILTAQKTKIHKKMLKSTLGLSVTQRDKILTEEVIQEMIPDVERTIKRVLRRLR